MGRNRGTRNLTSKNDPTNIHEHSKIKHRHVVSFPNPVRRVAARLKKLFQRFSSLLRFPLLNYFGANLKFAPNIWCKHPSKPPFHGFRRNSDGPRFRFRDAGVINVRDHIHQPTQTQPISQRCGYWTNLRSLWLGPLLLGRAVGSHWEAPYKKDYLLESFSEKQVKQVRIVRYQQI